MKSPIKAIVFDFGGVLLDWNPRNLYQRYFPDQQSMEDFLKEINFAEWNARQDKGRYFADGIADLSSRFPQHAHLIEAYFKHWKDSITGPIPGVVDILCKLKQDGYPLFGLSNWSMETFPLIRREYEFFDWFDDMVISGDAKLIKPHPAIFNLLLNKINYSAPECVLIDDSLPNIDTANELGFATIHFTSAEQLQIELQEMNLL